MLPNCITDPRNFELRHATRHTGNNGPPAAVATSTRGSGEIRPLIQYPRAPICLRVVRLGASRTWFLLPHCTLNEDHANFQRRNRLSDLCSWSGTECS